MFEDNRELTFLNDHTAPGEEIFAYPYCPMYYFLSATTNPTRYSLHSLQLQHQVPIRRGGQCFPDRRRVRYVIWDMKFSKNAAKLFSSSQPMRPDELIIQPCRESHYNILKDEDDVRIMERKAEGHSAD